MATWTKLSATRTRSRRAVQTTTDSAPTGDDGINLDAVESITPIVRAPEGETFDGTGAMLGYVKTWDDTWVRAPHCDSDMADMEGLEVGALRRIDIVATQGRFALVPSSVGLSDGTEVTTDYVCIQKGGGKA